MDIQYFDALHRILLSHLQRGNAMAVLAIIAQPQVHENPLFWRTCTYPEGLVAAMINASGLEACHTPPDYARQGRKESLVTPPRPCIPSEDAVGGSSGAGKDVSGDGVCSMAGSIQNPITPSELYIMLRWCLRANLLRIKESRSGHPMTRGGGHDTVKGDVVLEGVTLQGALGPQSPGGSRRSGSGHSKRGVTGARSQALLEGDSGAIILHTLLSQILAQMERPLHQREHVQRGDTTRESSRRTPTKGGRRRECQDNREGDVCGSEGSDLMPDLRMLSNLLQVNCSHMTYRNPLQSVLVPSEGCLQADDEGTGGRGPSGAEPCVVVRQDVRLDSTTGAASSGAPPAQRKRMNMVDVVAPTVELRKRARCPEDDRCAVEGSTTLLPLQKQGPADAGLDTTAGPDATTSASERCPISQKPQKGTEVPPQPGAQGGLTRMSQQIAETKSDTSQQPCGVSALFELLERSVAEGDALQVLQRVAAVPGTARVAENFDSVGDHPVHSRSPVARAVEKQRPSMALGPSQPPVAPPAWSQRRETSEPFASSGSVLTACHDGTTASALPVIDSRGEDSQCGRTDEGSAPPRAPRVLVRQPATREERVAAAIRAFDEFDSTAVYERDEGDGRATTGHPQHTASSPQPGTIKRRRRFTPEEDDAIIQGVKSFDYQGSTRFQYIFRAFRDVWQPGRTPTHLYDHWRDSLHKRVLQGATAGFGLTGRGPVTKGAPVSPVSSEIEEI